MHCIDCAFRRQDKAELVMFYCTSPKLVELSIYNREADYDPKGDKLVYSYDESGTFYVEDNFGCIHFKARS